MDRRSLEAAGGCVAHRYPLIAHGVGMCDEYPGIYYPQDWEAKGYDGEV